MDWSTACRDWEQRIIEGRSLVPISPLFPDEADAAMSVFNELRVVDVLGQPKFGDASRHWVQEFVAAIFGSLDPESGRRLIVEYMLHISKKNGKSTIAAGIMLTALILNWRHSAEFLIMAPTIETAQNAFKPARDMVMADEELKQLLHPQTHIRTITHLETGATLKVVAADSDTVAGKKATGVLVDELWQFGTKPKAESMLREATGGQMSRPEGFTIYLTTQSDQPPAGVFKDKLGYARKVRDGEIEDKRFLPVLYEFPQHVLEADGHKDRTNWYMTNPNLGLSVDKETIAREFEKADLTSEGALCDFLAKHLNVEIGQNLYSDRWPGADYWQPQGDRSLTLEAVIERSEVVTVGIDGGGLDDLLGLAVVGRDAEMGGWLLWNRAWAHPIALERRKTEAPRYRDFQRDGDLVLTDGLGSDVAEVAALVGQVEDSGKLDRVGLDPVGIGAVVDALQEVGIEYERLTAVTQGWKLSGAIKTTERELASGKLRHAGQPMMAWCVGNAKIEPRGNAILVTKQAAGRGKIDPLMATFNAIALMAMNPEPRGGDLQTWLDEPIMVV